MGELSSVVNVTSLLTCALLRALRTAWRLAPTHPSVAQRLPRVLLGSEPARAMMPQTGVKAARFLDTSLVGSHKSARSHENASQSREGWRFAATDNPRVRGRGGYARVF